MQAHENGLAVVLRELEGAIIAVLVIDSILIGTCVKIVP